jgi:hypothetical protein
MKHISPQLGFNNNVRHKGRVFHIQTEDSGVKHPHVITHLFADGGRILKSTKTSYAEFLGEDDLAKKVRSLMQEQHKAMFIALRGGKFDHMFPEDAAAEGAPSPRASSPGVDDPKAEEAPKSAPAAPPAEREVAASAAAERADPVADSSPDRPVPPPRSSVPGEAQRDEAPRSSESRPLLSALAAQPQAPLSRSRLTPPPPKRDLTKPLDPPSRRGEVPTRAGSTAAPSRPGDSRPVEPFAPTMPGLDAMRPSAVAEATRAQERRPSAGAPPAPSSGAPPISAPKRASVPPRAPLSESLELDLEALERAAEQTNSPVYQQLRDLPPPPATLLRGITNRQTAYRSLTPQAPQLIKEPPPKTPARLAAAKPPATKESSADRRAEKDHRYAHSRPASIFGPPRPQEGSNIFGEDLISEKSLDEVILSYLAEDLEPNPKK